MRLSYENKLLAILSLSFGFVFFDRLALSFLFPFVSAELHLDNAHLGMLSSCLALTWAISGAVLGAYSDRLPSKKPMLVLAVLGFSLCSALSGAVTGFVSLLLFRALMGIAEGPVLPLSQSMIAASSTPARRGLNMGIVNGAAPGFLGAVLGPPVIIWLGTHYGWRHAFYLSCVPGLIIACLIWKYVEAQPATAPPRTRAGGTQRVGIRDLLKDRNIFLCMLIACFYLTWFVIIISFTPTFLMQVKKYRPETMGYVMSCLGFAWVLWGFLVPAISDRIGRKPAMFGFSLVAACCPLCLLYVESAATMMPVVFLTYTGLGCFTLFMAIIPSESIAAGSIATALGLIMSVGELVGGFLSPTIAGLAADRFGLSIVMWIAAVGAFVPAILALFLKETAPLVVQAGTRGAAPGVPVEG
ncbi:MFS transporter [Duganella radicis]|uniref:MFS transporter n=1 Tax=Duganella radicis TaxID=551988 RepID=A0A6L6PD23_9BURK|nr:MFS transporter [Duganella radicis]MTV36958.1 MFS transporter [Duganella radicis]